MSLKDFIEDEHNFWDDVEEAVTIDPFHDDSIEGPGARAEITYNKADYGEWQARLLTGTTFIFRTGVYYDLALLTENGWVVIYTALQCLGGKDKIGKFQSLSGLATKPIVKDNVIVAARLSNI